MNPYIKNCRTGYHDDILNRTSHYLKLLNTKSSIINKHHRNYLSLLSQNNHKTQNQARIQKNHKLMNSLIEIEHRCSTYGLETERNICNRRASMKNDYEEKQRQLSLLRNNRRLYDKLVAVSSQISSDKLQKFDESVTRYAKLMRFPVREVTQMDSKFFQTYRQELAKASNSPTKYRILTQEAVSPGKQQKRKERRRHKHKRKFKKLFTLPEERTEHNPQSTTKE